MTLARQHGGWVIVLTFFSAFVLTIVPLPFVIALLRPEWLSMVLVYWCIALPHRVGVGIAWILGVMLDILRGTLLGQNALGLVVIAYLALKLHKRLRVFPPWQQALSVMMLIGMQQLLVLWITGLIGQPRAHWAYWLPSISSMLLWPWTFSMMRSIRRRFRVT